MIALWKKGSIYKALFLKNPIQHNFSRHCESLLFRCLLDCGFHNAFLHRIGYSSSSICKFCPSHESVVHILFHCHEYQSVNRISVIAMLNSLSISDLTQLVIEFDNSGISNSNLHSILNFINYIAFKNVSLI